MKVQKAGLPHNLARYLPATRCGACWTTVQSSMITGKVRWRRGWDVSGGSPAVEPTPPVRGRDLNSGACLSRALGRSATPAEVLW